MSGMSRSSLLGTSRATSALADTRDGGTADILPLPAAPAAAAAALLVRAATAAAVAVLAVPAAPLRAAAADSGCLAAAGAGGR